jgi:hypothetical protein
MKIEFNKIFYDSKADDKRDDDYARFEVNSQELFAILLSLETLLQSNVSGENKELSLSMYKQINSEMSKYDYENDRELV